MSETDTINVTELDYRAVNMIPQDLDFENYGNDWDYIEAVRCEVCDRVIIDGEDHIDDCDNAGHDAEDLGAAGPAMNFWYPVKIANTIEAAERLVDSSLVVVIVGDETGLALAGGGMDFTWEICWAFMLLGMLPPYHFTDLPAMAGLSATPRNLAIVAACRRTVDHRIKQGEWRLEALDRIAASLTPLPRHD